jgi:hypothetical protein
MINSYFKTTPTKYPTQSFYTKSLLSTEKANNLLKYKKYKLILLILSRATFKTLRLSF